MGQSSVITFADWGAYSRPEMRRWAANPTMTPLAMRTLFAALANQGRDGHCPFRKGELAELLSFVDTSTGELIRADRYRVGGAIKSAVKLGVIEKGSKSRCIILNRHAFQRASGPVFACPVHEIR